MERILSSRQSPGSLPLFTTASITACATACATEFATVATTITAPDVCSETHP